MAASVHHFRQFPNCSPRIWGLWASWKLPHMFPVQMPEQTSNSICHLCQYQSNPGSHWFMSCIVHLEICSTDSSFICSTPDLDTASVVQKMRNLFAVHIPHLVADLQYRCMDPASNRSRSDETSKSVWIRHLLIMCVAQPLSTSYVASRRNLSGWRIICKRLRLGWRDQANPFPRCNSMGQRCKRYRLYEPSFHTC